jgi:hypothetical protein
MAMKGLRRVLGVLAALSAIVIALPAPSAGARAPVVVHLKFRWVARGVIGLRVSGSYVTFTQATSTRQQFVLLDDRTGNRIVMPASCDAGVVGVPWAALYCGSSQFWWLYNIQTRKFRRFPCDALCRQDFYYTNLVAVGVSWLEVQVQVPQSCGDGVHYTCGSPTNVFYNIRTGKRVPFVDPTRIIDLDSPTLTRPVCSPLVGPPLAFYGSFAVAQEPAGIFLKRCGSQLNVPLVLAPYAGNLLASTHAVAFCSGSSSPQPGIFLPSLRRFTVTLPSSPGGCPSTVLGARHLYYIDLQERLWAAVFPSKPPRSGRHDRRAQTRS